MDLTVSTVGENGFFISPFVLFVGTVVFGFSFFAVNCVVSPALKKGDCRNWAELPPELTSSILLRLGAIEILENAQRVCVSWRRVCKDPFMWRKIDMRNAGELRTTEYEIMCRHAVDRSRGGLVEIDIGYFASDSLLNYIADSSSNLRSLRLAMCSLITDEGFVEAVLKVPVLEELEVSYGVPLSEESLRVVGKSCPNLKTLKLNRKAHIPPDGEGDDEARAIAETMPGLRHLQLFGNLLSNQGLKTILDNCPNLEHLDLRQCFNLILSVDDLEKRCFESIKDVRRPNDSTHDYPFDDGVVYSSEVEDYNLYDDLSGVSDHYDYDPYDINNE